jgi:hypothetical protein
MSLNWTRDNTQNKSVFGEVGFEGSYVLNVPVSVGAGVVASLSSNREGLTLETLGNPNGVQRNNGNPAIELYLVNYVFEAVPDAVGEASFTIDAGGSSSYLGGEKVETSIGGKIIVSGSIVVQSPNDGDVISIRSLHSNGCNYNVIRWSVIATKVGNRLS